MTEGGRKRFYGIDPELKKLSGDPKILKEIQLKLPKNFDFEIPKTLLMILKKNYKRVLLQFPEGLQQYSCSIVDIISKFSNAKCIVLGDICYGGCCIDDFSASSLDCDFYVHYGHSSIVPKSLLKIDTLHVKVKIQIANEIVLKFIESIENEFLLNGNVEGDGDSVNNVLLYMVATIQFVDVLTECKNRLEDKYKGLEIVLPELNPLSSGEILGCTAPQISEKDVRQVVVYFGDGQFHPEAMKLTNPTLSVFQFNQNTLCLSELMFSLEKTVSFRKHVCQKAKNASHIGIIFGTLGHQGNPFVLKEICKLLDSKKVKHTTVLLAEISPQILSKFSYNNKNNSHSNCNNNNNNKNNKNKNNKNNNDDIDAWIQIACPRLSLDWGDSYELPLLNCFEAFQTFGDGEGEEKWIENKSQEYLIDNFSQKGGKWSHYGSISPSLLS